MSYSEISLTDNHLLFCKYLIRNIRYSDFKNKECLKWNIRTSSYSWMSWLLVMQSFSLLSLFTRNFTWVSDHNWDYFIIENHKPYLIFRFLNVALRFHLCGDNFLLKILLSVFISQVFKMKHLEKNYSNHIPTSNQGIMELNDIPMNFKVDKIQNWTFYSSEHPY